ncbi:T9SS type A sorting domain-containing protein [Flavobacterium sp.]|uniref:T9SS type A sorting domain-containing protein n=1 Tax=Flavobacterium sp. TaxID=239 RepID=UPI00120EABEA|nr:T9SS type A sorting domain-containing protein [Flavobacterium sp.]RZJ72542.1 MAG: T9SS type A sorting domain-containing protein [Flavobacterium sp.]
MHLSRTSWGWLPLLSLSFIHQTYSQDIQWEKSYGGKQAEYLFDVIPTADYGFILAGSSASGNTGNKTSLANGDLDYWIWKMDEHGEAIWQKSFGGNGMDMLQAVRTTSDGGFLLAGTSNSGKGRDKNEDSKGLNDFWIIKLDAGGGQQWQKTIGGSGSDDLATVIQTKDGGYLIGGTSASEVTGDKNSKNQGGTDFWMVRLDISGNFKWQKSYGGLYNDQLRDLCATPDGGFMVLGYTNSPESGDKQQKGFGEGDYWLIRLDNNGEQIWQKTFGGDKDDQPFSVIALKDGGYLLGGNSISGVSGNRLVSSRSGSDFWVLNISEDGDSRWQESYNFGRNDILTSLTENQDGSILIGGHAKSENRGQAKEDEGINDYIALKINAKGEEIWTKHLGSDGDDILRKLIQTRDGGYLLAGTSNAASNNHALNRKNGKKKGGIHGISPIDGNQTLAASDKAQKEVDDTLKSGRNAINEAYQDQTADLQKQLGDAVGSNDAPLKTGLNIPTDAVRQGSGKSTGVDTGNLSAPSGNNYPKQPASKNKTLNYGNNDFWVVKLKDKDKKEKARQSIEASPNPTQDYTNVVIGYDFEKGTATIYDIAGHRLESFEITTGRTVPVNLAKYPQGIYLVEIKTEKSSDTVKIMKSK